MGRTVIAGFIAGLVVFVWGAVAHMLLPLGMAGMRIAPDASQEVALAALQGAFDREGIYMLPFPREEMWRDEAAMERFGAAAATRAFAFVVYQPQGRDTNAAFGPMLAAQLGSTVLAGLLAAFVAAGIAGPRLRRVLAVTAFGVFAWLAVNVPLWNWYRFPADFTAAALAEHGIGWLLAGLAIGAILRPRPA
jgi:hypothetical protein